MKAVEEKRSASSRAISVKAGSLSHDQAMSAIISIVKDLTGADVDPKAPLATQGLDSLASMELHQKIQARTPVPFL